MWLCCRLSSFAAVQFEPTFVPLNAEGLPVSLDAVSLCDTNSESYGSCKLNITVFRRAVNSVSVKRRHSVFYAQNFGQNAQKRKTVRQVTQRIFP